MRTRTSTAPDDAKRVTMQVSTVGIVCNAALTVFKLVAGIVAHSSAIVADAVHSASDILGSLIVMIGAVFSHKAADASHPYGHEKLECIASILLGNILVLVGAAIGYAGVMKIVRGETLAAPGVLALIAHVMATSDYAAVLDLGKFVAVSYGALVLMFLVHCLVLLGNRVSPLAYVRKAFPVLSFAFVSRSSAGALPLNIETQHKALGVDSASANLAASFGMSIGQNGCAGVYPAMLATIVAPTVGIDVLSPTFFVPLIAVVAISSFGVAGVGGGATFASLIVLGTMGLPIEVVAVLASVEPLIDMGRTALNVSDSMVAGITASHVAGGLDRSVLDDPEARVTAEAHVS